jgi:hypothetical protein
MLSIENNFKALKIVVDFLGKMWYGVLIQKY